MWGQDDSCIWPLVVSLLRAYRSPFLKHDSNFSGPSAYLSGDNRIKGLGHRLLEGAGHVAVVLFYSQVGRFGFISQTLRIKEGNLLHSVYEAEGKIRM